MHTYFVDASHFLYGGYAGQVWCRERMFVPPDRKRFNVLGAMHAVTHEVVQVVSDDTINSWSLNELFEKLREKHGVDRVAYS